MPKHSNNIKAFSQRLEEFRFSMAHFDALPQLTLMALIVGILTSLFIVGFRLAIELPFQALGLGSAENFEALSANQRAMLVISGALVIGIILQSLPSSARSMGVSHVLDRTHSHQGHIPGKNWLAQFGLAILCIVSGQSVGREGPAIHIGAGAASQIGNLLKLPRNALQTLIACGVAAGISASFDTPMAGVIFAMEVILMEYTIVGFVPVILSSVVGAAISRGLLGETIGFRLGDSGISHLGELSYVLGFGLVIACFAGAYIRLNLLPLRWQGLPVFFRILAGGLIVAIAAYFVPEIMGLGYDTIELALLGEIGAWSLLVIAIVKLVITPSSVGLGMPGGLIGPSLFIGACLGGAAGALASILFPELGMDPRLYILLGMTGMMAAVINAPLAALVAVLELSYNPELIFPAMLMIVVACLSTRTLFRVKGIFVEQLNATGRSIEMAPAAKALRRAGVTSIMERDFILSEAEVSWTQVGELLARQPKWLIFEEQGKLFALFAADLSRYTDDINENQKKKPELIALKDVPGRRLALASTQESDSLYQAYRTLEKSGADAVYVQRHTRSLAPQIRGIITHDAIHNYYRPKRLSNALG